MCSIFNKLNLPSKFNVVVSMVVVPSATRQSASERRGSPSAFLCVARQDNGWKDLYAPRSATTLVPPTFYVFPGYGHVFVLLLLKTLPTRESNFQLCSSPLWSFVLPWLNMVSVLFSRITNLNWIMWMCYKLFWYILCNLFCRRFSWATYHLQ